MILFDSHFHLYDDKYGNEQDEIIKNAYDNDVKYMTDIRLDEETSKIVIEQANKYEGLYAAIGMYPEYCNDDEIDLSYHTFLELYKFRIIYYLMKMDDITLSKAYYIWSHAYKFDNRVYEIMQFIVKKEQPTLLINRNPTLEIWCRKTFLIAGNYV